MTKKEREELEGVKTAVCEALDALMLTPVARGKALGQLLDSKAIIESMLATKKDALLRGE